MKISSSSSIKLLFCILILSFFTYKGHADNVNSVNDNESVQLEITTFDIDVTPSIGYKMAYNEMLNSWDMGLRAKGIILLGAGQPIVMVAIDWIGINDECYDEFKRAVASAAGTVPERVAVHTLHQHDAPRGDNLHDDFILAVIHRLEMAVVNSLKKTKPVTHIGLGESEVYKVASNRYILDSKADTVRANRYSACGSPALRAEQRA